MPLRPMNSEGRNCKLNKPNICQASGFEVSMKRLLTIGLGIVSYQGRAGNVMPVRKTLTRVNVMGGEQPFQFKVSQTELKCLLCIESVPIRPIWQSSFKLSR